MPRPTGVTVLAILYFVGTCVFALLGLASIVGMGFLAEMLARNPDIGPSGAALLAGAGIFLSIFFFGSAVLFGFLGYGMWNLRSWARTIAIVLSIIVAVLACLSLLWGIALFSPFRVIRSGIRLGIMLLILWYLNQPHVKAAFAMAQVPTAGIGGPTGTAR